MKDIALNIVGSLISSFILFLIGGLFNSEMGRVFVYRLLLKFYPKTHRTEFESEM